MRYQSRATRLHLDLTDAAELPARARSANPAPAEGERGHTAHVPQPRAERRALHQHLHEVRRGDDPDEHGL